MSLVFKPFVCICVNVCLRTHKSPQTQASQTQTNPARNHQRIEFGSQTNWSAIEFKILKDKMEQIAKHFSSDLSLNTSSLISIK